MIAPDLEQRMRDGFARWNRGDHSVRPAHGSDPDVEIHLGGGRAQRATRLPRGRGSRALGRGHGGCVRRVAPRSSTSSSELAPGRVLGIGSVHLRGRGSGVAGRSCPARGCWTTTRACSRASSRSSTAWTRRARSPAGTSRSSERRSSAISRAPRCAASSPWWRLSPAGARQRLLHGVHGQHAERARHAGVELHALRSRGRPRCRRSRSGRSRRGSRRRGRRRPRSGPTRRSTSPPAAARTRPAPRSTSTEPPASTNTRVAPSTSRRARSS